LAKPVMLPSGRAMFLTRPFSFRRVPAALENDGNGARVRLDNTRDRTSEGEDHFGSRLDDLLRNGVLPGSIVSRLDVKPQIAAFDPALPPTRPAASVAALSSILCMST
jgi:hypothetical protein